ncbi:MAG: winged helix-turn-helix transcriptional regulator, partial [Phycicoccus sp.]
MRTYRDLCGIARALDVVGERWALLVVRELMFGPKRFADLHRGLPGMSQNVLTQRLRELEETNVLIRRRGLPPATGLVYELTDHGRALEPVLLALGRWGSPLHPGPGSAEELSPDALVVALRTTFDPAAA